MKRSFAFIYPLTQGRVDIHRPGGLRYDHMGDLTVRGFAVEKRGNTMEAMDERYDFEIDEIVFDGVNIYPVLETFDNLDKIEAACYHHIHHMFAGLESDYEEP